MEVTVGLLIGFLLMVVGTFVFWHGIRKIGLPTFLTGAAIVASGLMNVPLLILLVPAFLAFLVVR